MPAHKPTSLTKGAEPQEKRSPPPLAPQEVHSPGHHDPPHPFQYNTLKTTHWAPFPVSPLRRCEREPPSQC